MCLPVKSDQPSSSTSPPTRSIFGLGALMLLACLAGPAIAGAVGSLGFGILVGAGGVVFALALCAAIPAGTLAWRRRSGSQLGADRTSNPSSTAITSTPASASRPRKPSMSEPV